MTDLTTVADADLYREMDAIQAEMQRRVAAIQAERATRESAIIDSVAALSALIGPTNPTVPALTSLTEVQLYTNAQMAANVGQALRLILTGMERLARTTRDIAATKA